MKGTYTIYSFLYTIPMVFTFFSKILSNEASRFAFIYSTIAYGLILIIGVIQNGKSNKQQSKYSFPFVIIAFGMGLFLAITLVQSLLVGGVNLVLSRLPRMITELILSFAWSIVPLLVSLAFINKQKKMSNIEKADILDANL